MLLILGTPSLGGSCQGQCPGLGDLLILNGWCLNQKWLSKRAEWTEDGIGQPDWAACGFSCPCASQEGIPGLIFHSLWLLDTLCYRISWRQGPQNLILWQGSLSVLSFLSLPGLCVRPRISFMHDQLYPTPSPGLRIAHLAVVKLALPFGGLLWGPQSLGLGVLVQVFLSEPWTHSAKAPRLNRFCLASSQSLPLSRWWSLRMGLACLSIAQHDISRHQILAVQ
jgi:hypothetical protein